ncbi:hypothetical protein [Hymenobacter sp. BRD67]|uniref:hypothetical protein n=1 Tax=Hymenobacter sp. BRD67 TaxID=2675877 RepID=UPI0015642B49|nr:hypothetical protein [Hymenobacter sp. BRD67]QKG53256.1 hypothetical protein GKZ67_12485 [Hymenobacter sp. BRD67]
MLLVFSTLAVFISLAQSAKSQLITKTVYNNNLLEFMTGELTVKHLQQVYGKELHKVTKDKLAVSSGSDKVEIYQNSYHSFLLTADFTSHRLAFGHDIRIGATKIAFCKAFGLSTSYDLYKIIENPEGGYDITFRFEKGVLVEVKYRVNYID